jgi:hypothetical protein
MHTTHTIDLSFLDDEDQPPISNGSIPEPLLVTRTHAWDQAAAIALMSDADGAVAGSGVSGTHPDVKAAADRTSSAYHRHDLAGVRSGCAELLATVYRLRGDRP